MKKLNAVLEFEFSNELHKRIGFDEWISYRVKVPDYIPEEQAALYILKLIEKKRAGKLKQRRTLKRGMIAGARPLCLSAIKLIKKEKKKWRVVVNVLMNIKRSIY